MNGGPASVKISIVSRLNSIHLREVFQLLLIAAACIPVITLSSLISIFSYCMYEYYGFRILIKQSDRLFLSSYCTSSYRFSASLVHQLVTLNCSYLTTV